MSTDGNTDDKAAVKVQEVVQRSSRRLATDEFFSGVEPSPSDNPDAKALEAEIDGGLIGPVRPRDRVTKALAEYDSID